MVVGTIDLNFGSKEYNVKQIHVYHGYNSTLRQNDIAILSIKGSFNFKYIHILKLPNNELQDKDAVILSGFGANEVFCTITSRYLIKIFPLDKYVNHLFV